jgi:Cft2 family RNA processing exonuclease
VSPLEVSFEGRALQLPALGLWLDPHKPLRNGGVAFVSHAHSDHTAAHREVILTAPTQKLMRARVSGQRREHVLPFGQRVDSAALDIRDSTFVITLLPAGHILGSAMAYVEADGGSLLYTGDFKLRPGRSAEPCHPRGADTLIMETTFGRPRYVFPPVEEVIRDILQFCTEALADGATPVLLCYSLGKSQEVLSALVAAQLPVMMHSSVARLTSIYTEFGHHFPGCETLDPVRAAGRVVLSPPGTRLDSLKVHCPRLRLAVLTGWALDSGCRFRYGADAAFPLSDHADFPDLLEFVKRVNPRRVLTLHGFATDFAETLRRQGVEAWALGEANQLLLALD